MSKKSSIEFAISVFVTLLLLGGVTGIGVSRSSAASTQTFSLSSSTSTLNAGEINNITIYVTNSGNATMQNLTLSIVPSQFLSVMNSDGTFSIGSIPAGNVSAVDMSIFVGSSAPSPVTMSIGVSFTGVSNTIVTQTRSLSFFAIQTSNVSSVSVLVSPSIITAGTVNNLTVTVQNTGTSTINAVSATFLFPASSTLVTWLQPQIVQASSLAPRQNITVQAQVYESANAPSST